MKPFRLKHPVSEYSNSCLRDLNASLPSGVSPEKKDLYRIIKRSPDALILWDGVRLRRTHSGQPTVGDLIQPGTKVKSTFMHGEKLITCGPYLVSTIREYEVAADIRCWAMTCKDMTQTVRCRRCKATFFWRPKCPSCGGPQRQADSFLNEVVAINGRILGLFEKSTNEVHVLSFTPAETIEDTLADLLAAYVPKTPEFPFKKGTPVIYEGRNYFVGGKISRYITLASHWGSDSGVCIHEPRWHAITMAPCDRKNTRHCTGEDVRVIIERPSNDAPAGAKGPTRRWCKGCRDLMHGGYRFPGK